MKNYFSKTISILLHPLFMPSFGILMLFHSYLSVFIPSTSKWIIFSFVFIFTAFLPAAANLILLKIGKIADFDIKNRNERTLPYTITLISYLLCVTAFYKVGAPLWILASIIGASVSISCLAAITLRWKISAHLSGIGGLSGAIFGIAYMLNTNPYPLFTIMILLAGALAYARIELKAHTVMQTIAGFLLGFLCLFTSIVGSS